MVLVFYILNPNYLSPLNIVNILNQVSILAIITVGASVVVFSGGFDLSAGSVLALSAVVGSIVIDATGSIGLGILAGVAAGTAVGLVNGFVVGYLGVSPLIVTLGSMNVARGLAFIVSGGIAIHNLPPAFSDFAISRFLGLPSLAWVTLAAFVAMHLVLKHTPFGINVYAAGGNPVAARLSGINVGFSKMMAFAISGATAGLAGMMLAARTNGGEPGAGVLYELDRITRIRNNSSNKWRSR